jgi:uncharacterized protein involved in exopolysaccharide biosynthesis
MAGPDTALPTSIPGSEVGSIAPLDSLRRLRRNWLLVGGTAAGFALIGLAASFLVRPEFEAEVDLALGVVNGQQLETPQRVADLVESEGFRQTLEAELQTKLGLRAIRAEVVGAGEAGASAYLKIATRRETAADARTLSERVAASVQQRHAALFESASSDLSSYREALEGALARLDSDVAAIQAGLGNISSGPNAVATLLLHSNLATARTQQLELRKQLRDTSLALTLATRPTRLLGPPSHSESPAWPSRVLFVLLGALAGLGTAVTAVLLRN